MYPEFYQSFFENLEITFNLRDVRIDEFCIYGANENRMRQELYSFNFGSQVEQQGVDPRKLGFLVKSKSRSGSQEEGPAGGEDGTGTGTGYISMDIGNFQNRLRIQRQRNNSDSITVMNYPTEDEINQETYNSNW